MPESLFGAGNPSANKAGPPKSRDAGAAAKSSNSSRILIDDFSQSKDLDRQTSVSRNQVDLLSSVLDAPSF
jgi:hypothetical protein